MAELAELHSVSASDPVDVVRLARQVAAELVVIGPEAPLVAGVADALRAEGFAVFGPDAAAARIEGSKAFAKEVMTAAGIPTAQARVASTAAEAEDALRAFGAPYVVKDDALAAGKGVVVTEDFPAALAHAASCGRVVIEEYLDGPEVSLFAVADGADGGAAARGAGLQAGARRRPGAEHRGDGRLRAAALGTGRAGRRGDGHGGAACDRRAGAARDAVPRAAVRRACADRARA